MSAYLKRYPPEQSSTYVKATSYYNSTYYPHYATDPSTSYIGNANEHSWITSDGALPQKLNVDLGEALDITRVDIDNYHHNGGGVTEGVKDVKFYGTNSSTAFNNTTGTDTTDLTLLDTWVVAAHTEVDEKDTQEFTLASGTSYRYYVFIIESNYMSPATATYYGIRRIQFHTSQDEFNINTGDTLLKSTVPYINDLFIVTIPMGGLKYSSTGISYKEGLYGYLPGTHSSSKITDIPEHNAVFRDTYIKQHKLLAYTRDIDINGANYGYIEGTVSVSGVAVPNVSVKLYYEPSGYFVSAMDTGADGVFRFDNLRVSDHKFTVLAYHDDFNALIYSGVTASGTAPNVWD